MTDKTVKSTLNIVLLMLLLTCLVGFASANPFHYTIPTVTVNSPVTNMVYDNSDVSLNVKVEMSNSLLPSMKTTNAEELTELKYSLDSQPEKSATIKNVQKQEGRIEGLATATLSGLSEGAHELHIYGQTSFNLSYGNFEATVFFIVKTDGMAIEVQSPRQITYRSTSILLGYRSDRALSWVGYCLDQKQVVPCPEDKTVSNLFNGAHTLRFYGKDNQGNVYASKEVKFTIDGKPPPTVTIDAQAMMEARKRLPSDYGESTYLHLIFYVNEPATWTGFSLDGGATQTVEGNRTIGKLSYGSHTLIVYAKDVCGNMGESKPYTFVLAPGEAGSAYNSPAATQTSQPTPEMPTDDLPISVLTAGSIVLIAIVLVVCVFFFKRRQLSK